MDQRLSYYRPHLKAVSWVPRMMCHMHNISVVNAYILFKEYYSKGNSYHLINFIDILIDSLAEEYVTRHKNIESRSEVPRRWRTKATWEKSYLERVGKHHDCVIIKASSPYLRPDETLIQRHFSGLDTVINNIRGK